MKKDLFVVAITVSLLLMVTTTATQYASADPLNNAVTRQRIGNYDFEIALMPNPPVAGSPSSLMLRLAGVNGDDLVDVPVTLRLAKGGEAIYSKGPVIVPFGHYTLDYTFSEPGRYTLYADLQDYAYSGETLTFTFLLNVAGPNDFYLYTLAPGASVAAAAGAAGAIVMMKRRKKA